MFNKSRSIKQRLSYRLQKPTAAGILFARKINLSPSALVNHISIPFRACLAICAVRTTDVQPTHSSGCWLSLTVGGAGWLQTGHVMVQQQTKIFTPLRILFGDSTGKRGETDSCTVPTINRFAQLVKNPTPVTAHTRTKSQLITERARAFLGSPPSGKEKEDFHAASSIGGKTTAQQ